METKKLCGDLMIGDWVECNGKFIQVENVHKDMINYTPDIPYVQEEYFIEGKDITPIPLTAEILEKNGFTRLGTSYILEGEHFGLDNPSNPNNYLDNFWLRFPFKAVHIEHVHELQRALKLLKINKDIVL